MLSDYVDKQIKEAGSLEELIQDYEISLKEVKAYEAENSDLGVLTRYQQQSIEPYKTKLRLEDAIDTWEQKSREYGRVWFQWSAGLILFFVGIALFRLSKSWIALSLHIAGLTEMIWWSSPTRMMIGALAEHERLLNAKLLLTLVTFALLMAAWYMSERSMGSSSQSE
ncbi:MAG: hypothetical protein QGG54_03965 [Gammaproteobacteria bacterium]|nr:hypothetical protein [Chromatiales bacterium]MDP6414176.1 hypothetical protein [Gammaproteobacteria bacterium]MDP6651728.1 hypothetical protein [Gammaproteobacteria bacterium]